MVNTKWETVIGLEVHTQLSTHSKLFSGAATTYGAEPNTQACAIDLAMPGTLPVLNHEAVRKAIAFGLSIHATIAHRSEFARKNYFYPDLPKGYQISQFAHPIIHQGYIDILLENSNTKRISITRAHLEEDAGKSIHDSLPGVTGIDLNRAGTPLLEIVSEPDLRSAKEAVAYLKAVHQLVRYLDISDGNMQEGSFRCDVNVSLRLQGTEKLGTRVEIKNINSFRFVERAIEYEIKRQANILEQQGTIVQETRLYDADADVTRSMRSKEEAQDYRYFPDPDLLPLVITNQDIETIRQTLPELPWQKRDRYQHDFALNVYDASLLAQHRDIADYFEATLSAASGIEPKLAANWINGDLSALINNEAKTFSDNPITPSKLASLLLRIHDQTISNNIGKQVLTALWQGAETADEVIEVKGLKQITDIHILTAIIDEILTKYPTQIEQYRNGKEQLFGFFVGHVMKATQGKANPDRVNQLLREKLQG